MISDILESMGQKEMPRLVELGKIKIGGLGAARQKQGGNGSYRIPQKHDFFTITTLQRGPDQGGARGDLLPDKTLMDALGSKWADADGKLRQIPVYVLSDDIDDILQTAYVWYGRTACGARSDGKTITWFFNPDNNQRYDEPLVEPFRAEILEWKVGNTNTPMFKLHSVFNCVIAADKSRWGGVYKFRTTSMISFKQLYSSLIHLSQLTGGVLIGMPLMLKVRPVQVSPEGKTTTVHVVHVELMGEDLFAIQKQALLQAEYKTAHRQKLIATQSQYRALLSGPGQEGGDDVTEIVAEFHPDEANADLGAPAAPENGYGLLDEISPSATAEPEASSESVAVAGTEETQVEPPAEEKKPTWPDRLPKSARGKVDWINDAVVMFKPREMSAHAARDAFHAMDEKQWALLGAVRQGEKYESLKDGTIWQQTAVSEGRQ